MDAETLALLKDISAKLDVVIGYLGVNGRTQQTPQQHPLHKFGYGDTRPLSERMRRRASYGTVASVESVIVGQPTSTSTDDRSLKIRRREYMENLMKELSDD